MTMYLRKEDHDSFLVERYVKVLKFTASWCGPCKTCIPKYVELSEKYPDVMFVNVDIDEETGLAEDYDIRSVPTFIVLVGKNQVLKISGGGSMEFRQLELAIDKATKEV